jgi:chromosome segregation ATPase
MSKFGSFLGRKAELDTLDIVPDEMMSDRNTAPNNIERLQRRPETAGAEPVAAIINGKELDIDDELFSPLAIQLGEENESVRNLLIEATNKIRELDSIRDAFGKLVDPVSKTLKAYEQEKSEKLSLQSTLAEMRNAYNKTRGELAAYEKKSTALESECIRLRQDFSVTQQNLRTAEATKAEQAVELQTHRAAIIELDRRLKHEIAERESFREEHRRLGDRLAAADKRIVQLESEGDTARQKLVVAEREKATLQSSFDNASGETARLSRKVVEAENTVAAMQGRVRQIEANFTELSADRARLAQALDEERQRHQNETRAMQARLEALQTRAITTEKLLDEARAALLARAEEIRTFERRAIEGNLTRNALESRLSEMQNAESQRNAELNDAEQGRMALNERVAALTKAVKTRETALARAEERIAMLSDRTSRLESELQANNYGAEKQIEELTAALQRERAERAMAEGALETGRRDLARLLREVATLQQDRNNAELDPRFFTAA